MQFKAKQLMSDFMILLKYPHKRENKIKPSTKFVVIKEPAPRVRSNMLVYRVVNLHKVMMRQAMDAIRERGEQNKINYGKKELER